MNHLFIFTIGPVQPLIEKSRKARDMYAGSKMLSELMENLIQWLNKKENVEVVFPLADTCGRDEPSNIPNRLIAKIFNYKQNEMRQLADDLSAYTKKNFVDRCIKILSDGGIKDSGLKLAQRQLADFLEIYWLYEHYDCSDKNGYADAYKRLFTNINVVKGVKRFSQTMEPWGRKCLLFPEYNAIFAKRNQNGDFPKHVNPHYVYEISADNPNLRYIVKENEALCAIALVKRMYQRPETTIYSIRQMLMKSRIREDVEKKLSLVFSDDLANVLYDFSNGNLPSEKEYDGNTIQDGKKLWDYLQENKEENHKLAYYYALLKFDGDDMGTHFLNLENEDEQRQLSKGINIFGAKAPGMIADYMGLPIFAGGEDFFGILPLDGLFQCLEELDTQFQKHVGLKFSAGIAVAHVMQPLKHVTAMVNHMEKAAKMKEGKHAFAVGIMKHSGSTVEMPAFSLSKTSCQLNLGDLIETLLLLKDQAFSKAFIFQVSLVFRYFGQYETKPLDDMAKALLYKAAAGTQMDDSKIKKEELVHRLMKIYHHSENIREFLHILNGIAFFAKEAVS